MTLQYVFHYSLVAQQVEFDQLTGVGKYNRPLIKEVMCSQLEPTDITTEVRLGKSLLGFSFLNLNLSVCRQQKRDRCDF